MPTPDTAVNAIADRFWEGMLRESPTTATVYGDERYDDRLDDPGPAGRAAAEMLQPGLAIHNHVVIACR